MGPPPQPATPMAHGVLGRLVNVKTNSFPITKLPRKPFYHYDIVIMKLDFGRKDSTGAPSRKEVKVAKRYMDIINKMHDMYHAEFNPRPSYDGVKNMFSSVRHDNRTYTVHMTPNPKQGVYEVRITLVNEIPPQLLHALIAPGSHTIDTAAHKRDKLNPDTDIPPLNMNAAALMLLQVVVLQAPHIRHNFSLHSKAFYIQSTAQALSGGLKALQGFFQSVRPSDGRFIINVDTTTAAFYNEGWLPNLAVQHLRPNGTIRDVVGACQDRAKLLSLRTFLRGLKVMLVPRAGGLGASPPRGDSYRIIQIKDIKSGAGHISFDGPQGEITIKEYWQETHNSSLQYPDLFGITDSRGSIFPSEKCWVLPGQRYSRKLPPEDMRTFLKIAMLDPRNRIRKIEQAVRGSELNYSASTWMHEADITVEPEALQIQGRELSPPTIQYAGGSQRVAEGKWNVVHHKFVSPREIKALGVLVMDTKAQPDAVKAFVQKLCENMSSLGIKLSFGKEHIHYTPGNQFRPETSLREAALAAIKHLPPVNGQPQRPDMLIVILPAEAGPIRQTIKYYGDVEYGIATQCVRRGKYDIVQDPTRASDRDWRSLDQYCNNVALKINAKLGGINSYFRSDLVESALFHSMVVGCDISHPGPGVRNRPSIASLTASIDAQFFRYSAHVRCQDPRQEVIEDLGGMLMDAINGFRQRMGGNVPEKIIIYRDGVSEGEYARVMSNEIQQVEATLYKIKPQPPYKPQIVFIVVGKRHHVRFFPTDQASGDRKGNCNPGLVVDREVVHSTFQSFYLQSHAGIIGTSRPSHYIVLRNDSQWTQDQLQSVSYALCHVYAPATRSVSIPAPVYYADKLCTHGAYQFTPQDGMANYEDSASGVGSGDDAPFNLENWRERLKPAHVAVKDRMYFI